MRSAEERRESARTLIAIHDTNCIINDQNENFCTRLHVRNDQLSTLPVLPPTAIIKPSHFGRCWFCRICVWVRVPGLSHGRIV